MALVDRRRPASRSRLRRGLAFLAAGAPPLAAGLSYAWLLPPLAALAVLLAGGAGTITPAMATAALVGWAAVTLSFTAGVRWGDGMRSGTRQRLWAPAGAALALIGWLCLLLPPVPALAILAASLAAQGAWDAWAAGAGQLAPWYGRLRIRATWVAVAILVAALIALA